MKVLKISYLSVLLILLVYNSNAQDRQFARTYQSTVLPKGAFDVEMWNTFRTGRNYFYNRLDQRLELEYGVTDKFQNAFYLNATHKAKGLKDSAVSGIEKESEFSFSHEMKWQLSNPSADKLGFGLYTEYTIASNEVELEGKILIDKKTEKNIFAYNLVGEYEMEWEVEKGETEIAQEIKIENDLGYMRMFKPTFGLGLEFRNHNVMVDGELEHSAVFGGPTLFWSSGSHFIILNILPQWTNLKNTSSLDLNEYEKVEIRLLVGFSK